MRIKPFVGFLAAMTIAACIPMAVMAADVKGNLVIKGSDTMVYLGQAWAEAFMKKHAKANVSVTGGGSGTGIAALINGTTDLCQASRSMKGTELDAAKKKGRDTKETIVAMDGIAVVTSPKNPVKDLTMDELKKVFTGEITNWKELGGKDSRIILLSREVSSGTHVYFKEHVLKNKNYSADALLMPSSQAIIDEVAQNADAIGYVGVAYGEDKKVRMVGVRADEKAAAILPTDADVKSGKYPISRPLFIYTASGKSIVKEYISFMLSPEGQRIAKANGFVSIK